nr:hypothetical protein [Candidatus Sigynarchaeum springense]
SIITSMGFLVQDLLLHSSPDIFNGKDEQIQDAGTKWDLVKRKDENKSALILDFQRYPLYAFPTKAFTESTRRIPACLNYKVDNSLRS